MGNNRKSSFAPAMHARRELRLLSLSIVLLLALSPCVSVDAQAGSPPALAGGLDDSRDTGHFIDGLMRAQIDEGYSPGGCIAIVNGGEIVYAQGYGFADVENRTPVDPDGTLFRIGSCSKAFTATAVMQLVGQGRLDLDRDVNVFLRDFKVPANRYGPITLEDLMTHKAGFEVQDACGKATVVDRSRLPSLSDYIAHAMPARVRPPGEATSYSNYGVALEGYTIEQVTGISYDDYLDQNVFAPLGMRNSTSRQPVPGDLEARLARGYYCANGSYRPGRFEYVVPAPAGSISASATDVARYMLARLHGGQYDNGSLLDQGTANKMLTRQFTNDPRLNGMAYGMVEMDLNGKRVLFKNGDTLLFHSFMCLLPDEEVGLFVAFNGDQGAQAYLRVLEGFFNRYYPAGNLSTPVPMAGYRERAAGYAGTYFSARTAYTTIEKVVGGLSQQYTVTENPDGTIGLAGLTFVEVQPGYFEQVNGTVNMVFRDSPDGRTQYLFIGSDPEGGSLVKAAWYETAGFHMVLLALCLLTFLSALIAWPVSWLLGRKRPQASESLPKLARWAAGLACALDVGFVAGFLLLLATSYSDLAYGVPLTLLVVLTMPLIAALMTIAAVGFGALAWQRKHWGLPIRIHYTIVTVALVAFLWSLNFWNLLGYKI